MINAISLFTGAGGMDLGFESAGAKIVLANEIDKTAAETYRLNHPRACLKKRRSCVKATK